MVIGIDASRAFLKKRTGIEEYAYKTIKHLRGVISEADTVILYVPKKLKIRNGKLEMITNPIDFSLPKNWSVCAIWAPRFWTQIGLSFEMLLYRPDVLFVPAHTVPFIHPKKTIVTIHGLEYEFCPGAYSLWERLYMRCSIRFSCRAAKTVICVSENTKKDVMWLYGVPEEKIVVIHEGYESIFQSDPKAQTKKSKPYLLFIGRLEERKNIVRIIEAFEMLKAKHGIPHQIVLIGKPGFGYNRIACKLETVSCKQDVLELGYVSEKEKWDILKNADVFLFPTLYEGFGIPVLEAQSVGVPVVTSNISSLPEVAGAGAVYADPQSVESIVMGVQRVLSDKGFRDDIIEKATHNVSHFGWVGCAEKISRLFVSP